jgi:hypothetical protein
MLVALLQLLHIRPQRILITFLPAITAPPHLLVYILGCVAQQRIILQALVVVHRVKDMAEFSFASERLQPHLLAQ